MMASNVIDLLDSDEEDAPPPPPVHESIDLCDSSDEEETKKPPAIAKRQHNNATTKTSTVFSKKKETAVLGTRKPNISRAAKQWDLDSDDDAEFDELLKGGPIFAKKLPPKTTTPSTIDLQATTSSLPQQVAMREAPPVSQTPAAASLRPGSDDDDNDADLWNYYTGYAKATPAAAKKPASQANSTTRPSSSDRPFPYPTLLANSKQYPDERARLALAFWRYGRTLTQRSFERQKLDQTAKRLVRLVLREYPVRSLEEYTRFGQTSVTDAQQTRAQILDELRSVHWDRIQTPITTASSNRLYYTITEACLVAMLKEVESQLPNHDRTHVLNDAAVLEELSERSMWVPLQSLLPAIDGLLRPDVPVRRLSRPAEADWGEAHYLKLGSGSMEFFQITKLETSIDDKGPRIKRHKKNGQVYYELLPSGYMSATIIRSRQFPLPPGHYRCSEIATVSQVQDRYKGICLGVDSREGGGGNNVLHQMCNKLDMQRVPFFVGNLSIGDYVFFTSKDGGKSMDRLDLLCPIIVERKSVQDVAQSIHDGRWQNQKRRMYHGQYVFGYDNCTMVFIIEGNENRQMVSGGYVGARWFNVDKEKLHEEIDNLKAEGFEVIRTPSRENTMFELARWAQRVASEMKSGVLKAQYTYSEFKQKVGEISKHTDFSRLAKDHMRRKLERESEAKRPARDSDMDNDIEVLSVPDTSVATLPKAAAKQESPKKPSKKKQKKSEEEDDEFFGMSTKQLKEACVSAGLAKSGTRADLVARLQGPRKPKLLLERKRKGEYVPDRHNVGGTALLVALYLHEEEMGPGYDGMTKDELYVKAEGLSITKNPFSGGTTQTGPYHYDGWSNMKKLLTGDPPLVLLKKRKYKLTRSCNIAGYGIAKAMHIWCHQHGNCQCGREDVSE